MARTAPIRIRILKVSTRLFAALGSSLALFAKRERYLVNSLSMTRATTAMTTTVTMM